jgi:hypothetical protein
MAHRYIEEVKYLASYSQDLANKLNGPRLVRLTTDQEKLIQFARTFAGAITGELPDPNRPQLDVPMSCAHRDVLMSLVSGAKDDVSRTLKVASEPNQYSARAVELLRRELDLYAEIEKVLGGE